MAVSLEQIVYADTNYIAKLENNRQVIENALNELYGFLSGGQTGGGAAVPSGLKEIFDRRGIIGAGSYDFDEGVLTGPNYNLTLNAGAYWNPPSTFFSKSMATTLTLAGQSTGTLYVNLDATGAPVLSATPDTTTTRQFHWDEAAHTVSAKGLYAGVAILLDGDAWNELLTSSVKGKSWEAPGQRLKELEEDVAAVGDVWAGFYAQGTHSGLAFHYAAGKVRNDSVIFDTPAGQVNLAGENTNYIEVNPEDGIVSANQIGFTSGRVPLYVVWTGPANIIAADDKRTSAMVGTGEGSGGGHTQGTDTGTTASTFLIDSDAAGSPVGMAGIEVENGDNPNASLKFNRDTGKWQFSEGGNWHNLGEYAGENGPLVTEYVALDDPPLVLEALARGSSPDWEDLDLSAYVTAPDGVAAVALLVYFWDSSLGSGVSVLFKKKDSAAFPVEGFTVWSGQQDPGLRLVPVDANTQLQFLVNASGASSANLKIFLLGYHKLVYAEGPKGDKGDQGDQGPKGDPGTTEDTLKTFDPINVSPASSVDVNLTGFITRGLAHYVKVQETGGLVNGSYHLAVFARDTFLDADRVYILDSVDPTKDWEDWLPWMFIDADATNEMHVRLTNNDPVNQGTYVITIRAEKLA